MSDHFEFFIISGMAIAGTAVLWRNWLLDHPRLGEWIKKHLGKFHKALACGSCFTYWLSLIFIFAANPLGFWLPLHHSLPALFFNIFVQWMAMSWLGVFLRFSYVAIQELVSWQVHELSEHKHKN